MDKAKPLVVIGLLGTTLDNPIGPARWTRWRPTISLFQQEDEEIDRLELIFPAKFQALADRVIADIQNLSPRTKVITHHLEFPDPWDFEAVYSGLHDFAAAYPFKPDEERYGIHITTGTHVAQICLFLLTESGFFPGSLIQTSPPRRGHPAPMQTIELDLARYDRIASRFAARKQQAEGLLKSGIVTRNQKFNALIGRIEQVALASTAPMLLWGPTGAGKSQLAKRIYELKRDRRQVSGPLVEVNCATLRGDSAMSALFGHTKGAFTGAESARKGLLLAADRGVLFLDEIGELGRDEQAMLLRAIEEKRFLPLGTEREVVSDFQLIAGTNRSLAEDVRSGRFREDLYARINLWTFLLPGLAERPEDIEPNLHYELEQFARKTGRQVRFNREAREAFLRFAAGPEGKWTANFRDLNAAVVRMATLAAGGRIDSPMVEEEIGRLRAAWSVQQESSRVIELFGPDGADDLDRFDRVQLEEVLKVCSESRSLSEAGRTLFAVSRKEKASVNDADRLRKYLARFGLAWADVNHGL